MQSYKEKKLLPIVSFRKSQLINLDGASLHLSLLRLESYQVSGLQLDSVDEASLHLPLLRWFFLLQ